MDGPLVVIGAGIAGLAAGCYARMNGLETRIFEAHTLPGGVCTAWRRGGYTFDGCIAWLVGTAPGSAMHETWRELGALEGRRVYDPEELTRVEGPDGRVLVVYRDADRLEEHLLERSPRDAGPIAELCDAIRLFSRWHPRRDELGDVGRLVSAVAAEPEVARYLRALPAWGDLTLSAFAGRFRDPFLRESLPKVFDMPGFPMIGVLATLGWMHLRSAGCPIGGSLEVSRAIERRCRALGGEVTYAARVARILVEDDRAVGVALADGTEVRAGHVLSAADGHATLFGMLGDRYDEAPLRARFEARPTFPSQVRVSLGVARDLSAEPASITLALTEPIRAAGEDHSSIAVRHYCHDATMAPSGKSVLVASFPSEHARWETLAGERAYEAEKRAIAAAVIGVIDRRFPGVAEQVEVVDVATPRTFARYTGNWRGATEGWLLTTRNWSESMSQMLPGLRGFSMAGHWVEPGGGVSAAATSARRAVAAICRGLGRPFRATTA